MNWIEFCIHYVAPALMGLMFVVILIYFENQVK